MYFTFTKASKNWNEDRGYSCENFAFAIDGATGSSGQKFSNKNTDAEWYSEWWYNYLQIALHDYSLSIPEILHTGMDYVIKDFNKLTTGKDVLDFPSSTINIARKLDGNNLEVYLLCDSPVILQTATGHSILIADTLNNNNDNINFATIEYYAKRDNISFFEARKKYNDVVFSARGKKNKKWGYNVLSDSHEAIDRGIYRFLDGNIFKKAILMTDGFSKVFDTFKLYTIDEFANKLNSLESAEQIYNELYNAQENDKDANKFIRSKIRDDATVSVFEMGDN